MSTYLDTLGIEDHHPLPPAHSSIPQVRSRAGYEHMIRWRPGERLEQLFESQCDRLRRNGRSEHPAVDTGTVILTYDQLDARANRLARHLLSLGAGPGDRIALLFDQAVYSYIAMLAVLKINAAYVPLDVGFPADRLSYIVHDAEVGTILSLTHLADRLEDIGATAVPLDAAQALIDAQDDRRLTDAEKGDPVDELCYIIYTSGSTGRPKGVMIEHAGICNFVRVAAEVYGIEEGDRVYQGMTIAFDFSVEEIWVPWMAAATLVPKPAGVSLLGRDLWEFLQARDVTAMCCVPTLLATLDEDLPALRFLLVSGEACPQDLVTRWHRPDRRFLNVYGPTEATVTATWTPLQPDRPVTLGVPLPTYSVVILDREDMTTVAPGDLGEIGIAGIGLADGYVNRADLTAKAFITDFLTIANNPSGRIYRTGDLGRVNDDGEIEYHGRIDTQVKIRGYRIELTEIESVLLQVPGIAQAVVDTYEPEPGVLELVGYYSLRNDTTTVDSGHVYDLLRDRLPGYMVPAYLEQLAAIPMLPSDKADRKNLPPPKGPRGRGGPQHRVDPSTETERILAAVLAEVVRVDGVSVESHFFTDLGANSLLMAQFCAQVRQRPGAPVVSMKDIYLHPTIRSLAAALATAPGVPAPRTTGPTTPTPAPARATTAQYLRCGALQLLFFLCSLYFGSVVLVTGLKWTAGSISLAELYLRSAALVTGGFFLWSTVPILMKWLLIGRWKTQRIPVWSMAYLRFWFVRLLIRTNPMVMFVGTPLYPFYLRALGAKVGRRAAVFSANVPICTDLLTIGDGTVIRKDSSFTCYRANAGLIETGPVTFGKDVLIGEQTVLDIGTALGDAAQLGHTSSLHSGQTVPAGQHWHGSPAQRADVTHRTVAPARCGNVRRTVFCSLKLLNMALLSGPLALGILVTLLTRIPVVAALLQPGTQPLSGWMFYRNLLGISAVLFLAGIPIGLAAMATIPRLLNLAVRPGRIYPLYGLRYWAQGAIARTTNLKFFMRLFGDSSYIVNYLRFLGYDLSRVVQTGSNFGNELKHDTPFHSRVGSGTMVSDGLSIINVDVSNTSFLVSPVSIPPGSFLGNNIAYPSESAVGDDCLLATKAKVPVDGRIRQGVGLLGSPSFEIPRSVRPDRCDIPEPAADLPRRLAAKNRYNLATIGLFLLLSWLHLAGVLVITVTVLDYYYRLGTATFAVSAIVVLVFNVAYSVLVERTVGGFRPLSPKRCSIYAPYYWWHERLWKLEATVPFGGTPFRSLIWRLLGVRLGRRLFDDGCYIPEKTLVTIGDDCTLNAMSVIQCHSQENGTFKSERTTLGDGCTIGIEAFVHYGVTVGDGAAIEAHSFVMKGTHIAPRTRWRGNPATEINDVPSADAGRAPSQHRSFPKHASGAKRSRRWKAGKRRKKAKSRR